MGNANPYAFWAGYNAYLNGEENPFPAWDSRNWDWHAGFEYAMNTDAE